ADAPSGAHHRSHVVGRSSGSPPVAHRKLSYRTLTRARARVGWVAVPQGGVSVAPRCGPEHCSSSSHWSTGGRRSLFPVLQESEEDGERGTDRGASHERPG